MALMDDIGAYWTNLERWRVIETRWLKDARIERDASNIDGKESR